MSDKLLENHIENINATGTIWNELSKKTIAWSIERSFDDIILKKRYISDIVINGDKVLIKWGERLIELTDEQVKEKYRI